MRSAAKDGRTAVAQYIFTIPSLTTGLQPLGMMEVLAGVLSIVIPDLIGDPFAFAALKNGENSDGGIVRAEGANGFPPARE